MIRLTIVKPADSDFIEWEDRARAETEAITERWNRACAREESLQEFLKDSNRIKDSLYRHDTVKRCLWEQYLRKCAFCERRLLQRDASIEHFRPKKHVTTIEGGRERPVAVNISIESESITVPHPGYYWLSYAWENLLLTCSGCNQRLKRCLFPLRDESRRALLPGAESAEEELLIHPGQSNLDLSEHFEIHRSGCLIPLTDRAVACVAIFELNEDEDLVEERRELYNRLRRYALVEFEGRIPGRSTSLELPEARKKIREANDGSLRFSAFGRAAIQDWRQELEECYQKYVDTHKQSPCETES